MKRSLASIALITSWLMIFVVITYFTQLVLVPWDAAITLPEIGTWQRILNDFFASAPGYFLFSTVLIVTSVVLTWQRLRGTLLMKLVLGNFTFALTLILAVAFGIVVNNAVLFPYPDDVLYDPTYRGFHRSLFPALCVLVACGSWLYWQTRLGSQHRQMVSASS